MDLGKNVPVDSKWLFAGLGNRGSGSLGVEAIAGGSGGLLETFDAVFRATSTLKPSEAEPESRRTEAEREPDGEGTSSQGDVAEPGRTNETVQPTSDLAGAEVGSIADTLPPLASEDEDLVFGSVDLEDAQSKPADAELPAEELELVVTTEAATDTEAVDPLGNVEDERVAEELASASALPNQDHSTVALSDSEEVIAATSEQTEQEEELSALIGRQVVAAGAADEFDAEEDAPVVESKRQDVDHEVISQVATVVSDSERQGDRGRRGGARYSNEKTDSAEFRGDGQPRQAAEVAAEELTGEQRELMLKLRQLASEQSSEQNVEHVGEGQAAASDWMSDLQTSPPVQRVGVERSLANVLGNSGTQNNQAAQVESSGDSRVGVVDGAKRRDDGGQGIAGQAKSAERGTNETQVRLVQRVARAMQRLGPGGGRVNIMLHPTELGSVKLELTIDGQSVNAKMTTESETAMSVLRENLPDLKQKLFDSGMVVEKIEIEVAGREADAGQGDSGRGGFQFGQGDHGRQGNAAGHWSGVTEARPATVETESNGLQGSPGIGEFGGRRTLDLKV